MYGVRLSHTSRKSLKKLEKSGAFDRTVFESAVEYLISNKPLPLKFKDHQLKGSLANVREFHIAYDVLVVYERDEELRQINILNIGSHNQVLR